MEFKEVLEDVQHAPEFAEWKGKNAESFLAHGFIELDPNFQPTIPWQIGYYNPDSDRIVTIKFVEGKLNISGEEEVFKKPDAVVEELDLEKVKLSLEQVSELVKEFKAKEYSAEISTKLILILQKVPEVGVIWNFTMVSMQMNTLNVWVDADTGEILKHKLVSLMNYKREDSD